jgi:hypothetical protein
MRQREGQTCKELYIYMCELENNIPSMTEDQQRAWALINALKPNLRSRVIRDLQTIDSVEAVIAYAGRNEGTSEKSYSRTARVTSATESRQRRVARYYSGRSLSVAAVLSVKRDEPNAALIWLICQDSTARLIWLERLWSVCLSNARWRRYIKSTTRCFGRLDRL